MKLYQYITSSAICLGLFFSSCNDWLDVTPEIPVPVRIFIKPRHN